MMEHEPSIIAIVDDDPTQRLLLSAILSADRLATGDYPDAGSLLATNLDALGVVCLDLGLGAESGFDVLAQLQEHDRDLPVVVITADGDVASAVAAMRAGAYDYLVKPVDPDRLRAVIARALERRLLSARVRRLSDQLARRGTSMLLGDSVQMQSLRRQIARVAANPVTVCIRGETGTGKELVARAIHEASSRHTGPFVPVNCAAIPVSLQESELFGHERGAFTGATSAYRGRFEQADRGTLFLDELGEMSPATQSSMLRALQDRTIRRLGSTHDVQIDARIVSATHRDLEDEVRAGRFREDLYYRLVIYPITVPPLRERLSDVPQLVGTFLSRIGSETGLEATRISSDALDALMRHEWPGNVRELQNVVHRAMLGCDGPEIALRDLSPDFRGAPFAAARPALASVPMAPVVDVPPAAVVPTAPAASAGPVIPTTTPSAAAPRETTLSIAELETAAILRALSNTHGNVSSAARLLKIGRATLYRRITELKLDVASMRADQA